MKDVLQLIHEQMTKALGDHEEFEFHGVKQEKGAHREVVKDFASGLRRTQVKLPSRSV